MQNPESRREFIDVLGLHLDEPVVIHTASGHAIDGTLSRGVPNNGGCVRVTNDDQTWLVDPNTITAIRVAT